MGSGDKKSTKEETQMVDKEMNKYHDINSNSDVKVYFNFSNNNIYNNIFSNLFLFEKRKNLFHVNKKTYMLQYNNHINEENFYISYSEKVGENEYVDISPWHHIPLVNEDGTTYNMLVEISKYTYMKLEINLKSKFNVIKQDLKKGKLRYYHNSIYWNYGALPQTYEYKKHIYKCLTNNNEQHYFTGDNDPLDIVEIGQASLKMGEIVPVKILGAFTLIDEGELDWKIIAINKNDKYFDQINSLEDIEKFYPSTVNMLLEWFRSYKMADSKKLNLIAKELYDKKTSEDLIKKTHEYYNEFLNDIKHAKEKTKQEPKSAQLTNTNDKNEEVKVLTEIDEKTYQNLLRKVDISYYKKNTSYEPDTNIWVPE